MTLPQWASSSFCAWQPCTFINLWSFLSIWLSCYCNIFPISPGKYLSSFHQIVTFFQLTGDRKSGIRSISYYRFLWPFYTTPEREAGLVFYPQSVTSRVYSTETDHTTSCIGFSWILGTRDLCAKTRWTNFVTIQLVCSEDWKQVAWQLLLPMQPVRQSTLTN